MVQRSASKRERLHNVVERSFYCTSTALLMAHACVCVCVCVVYLKHFETQMFESLCSCVDGSRRLEGKGSLLLE